MKWFIKRNIFSYQSMVTVMCDLTGSSVEKPPSPTIVEGMEIFPERLREITADDAKKLEEAIHHMDGKPTFDAEEAKKRLGKGFYFITLQCDNVVIGWNWGGINKVYFGEFNCQLKLKNDHAFIYGTYIQKEYRNKGINGILTKELSFHLKKDGYDKIWSLIHKWNHASIKSRLKMNWKIIGDYNFIKFLFMNFKFPPKGI